MSQRVLSDDEFAKQVNEGGATRRISDHTVPTTGFQVALPTRGFEGGDGAYHPNGPLTAHGAHAHQKYIEAAHGGGPRDEETGPHVADHSGYQGGWHDSETGVTHLDRSVRLLHPGLARSIGRSANQIAIWDNKAGDEIRLNKSGPPDTGYGPRPKGGSAYSDSHGRRR